MAPRFLGWSIIALLAASFGGNSSFAAPLEDGLAAPAERVDCTREFLPMRQEAERRGKLLKAASERHAPPGETCRLIESYAHSETRMINYLDASPEKCGIPPFAADQLKAGHKNTEAMLKKVCALARTGPAGPVGDFDDIGVPPLVR